MNAMQNILKNNIVRK